MKKIKSKEKSKAHIRPEQLRDALVMTGREYRKTPEYKEKAAKQLKEFIDNWKEGPQFKQLQEMAIVINERIKQANELGLPQIMKTLREQYISLLEDSRPKKIFFPARANNTQNLLPPEIIEEIARKSAEKIFDKIKEAGVVKKSIKKKINSMILKPGTRWENIKIRIIDENNVVIIIGNSKHETNYKKMGFEDERTGNPNKQWMFLWLLAIKSGSLSWGDYRSNGQLSNLSLSDINKFKKIKQLLAETLKNYFKINEDPFYSYRKEKAYRIKINLTQ